MNVYKGVFADESECVQECLCARVIGVFTSVHVCVCACECVCGCVCACVCVNVCVCEFYVGD